MDKSQELAILVYSCWKNSDMWDVLETLLKKYWKDCKYKIILLTDKYAKEKVNRVFDEVIECDDNWYEMITKGIEHAGTRYVMDG